MAAAERPANTAAEAPPDPRVAAFLNVLSRVPPAEAESALDRLGIVPLPEHVEHVLRTLHSSPAAAVNFFRWSGLHLRHSPRTWDAMVDVLGRNGLFDAMWDAFRSMRLENALSSATFALAFRSYCLAGRVGEAVMSFDVMDRYGLSPDTSSLNSLLSSICFVAGRPLDAQDVFDRAKVRVAPDGETFAVLLGAWERAGDTARAKSASDEMVVRLGWDPANVPAYDAFLSTLVRAKRADDALKFLRVMSSNNCFPGKKFFTMAIDALICQNDAKNALALWDIMVGEGGLIPDISLYNSMITLLCSNCDIDNAYKLLDQMPYYGVFADAMAYNTIFECLVRTKRARKVERFFTEMRKNEQPVKLANCARAIRLLFQEFNPAAAIEVWDYVVEEHGKPDEECANELLLGLRDLGRLLEVTRYVGDLINQGVEIRSSVMDKLKTAFYKEGKHDAYNRMMRRLKRH